LREQRQQIGICLRRLADRLPIRKGLFRLVDEAHDLTPAEQARRILVGFMTSLLKVHKGDGDSPQLWLDLPALEPRRELG